MSTVKPCLWFFLLFWLVCPRVNSQALVDRLRVSHFSIVDGLSQNSISSIYQDSTGFLWIATTDGLNRYDGYEFLVFKPGNENASGLISSDINKVIEDSEGTIWIATGLGAQRYHREKQVFQTLKLGDVEPGSTTRVHDMVDFGKSVYFGTDRGIYALNKADDTVSFIDTATPVTQFLAQDSTNTLFFTGKLGLYRLLLANNELLHAAEFSQKIGARKLFRVTKMLFSDNAQRMLWLASRDGLFRIDLQSRDIKSYDKSGEANYRLSDDFVQDIMLLENSLWVGTGNGLNKIDLASGEIKQYFADVRDRQGLSSNDITVIFQDNSGLIWLGTFDKGLNRWNPHHKNFKHFLNRADIENLSGSNYAKSILLDQQNRLWIGTAADGIYVIDQFVGTITHLAANPSDPNSLINNEITSLVQDYRGEIWVASKFHGISRLSAKGDVLKNYRLENGLLVSSIYEDRQGTIWITTNRGVANLDDTGDKFIEQDILPKKTSTRVIHQDLSGAYWIGSRQGLYRIELDKNKTQAKIFKHDSADSNTLDSSAVFDVTEGYNGAIWVATERGLNKIESQGGQQFAVDRVFERLGYSGAWVNSVLTTKNNYVWMGTNNGLKRYDPSSEKLSVFNHKDGLATVDFFVRNAVMGQGDRMYFGGANGVESLGIEELKFHRFPAPLVLTRYEAGTEGKTIINSNDKAFELSLPHDHQILNFHFSLLDFSEPSSNSYSYRVGSKSDSWLQLGKNNSLSLSNLQTGQYLLEIAAFGPRGVPSANTLTVNINVKQPFYQSQWFQVAYISLIVFAAIYLLYRQKVSQKDYFRQIETTLLDERKQHIKMHTEYKMLELKMEKLDSQLAQRDNTIRLVKKKYNDLHGLDSVTGLRTKQAVLKNIDKELSQVILEYQEETEDPRSLAVILIDIDGFHFINTHYGVLAGDSVLSQFANLVRGACRGSDTIIRWSAQQILVFAYFQQSAEVTDLVERIRTIVSARPFDLGNGGKTDLTCSIGFCTYPFFREDFELLQWPDILDLTEQALLACKRTSPNAWVGLSGRKVKDRKLFLKNVSYDIVAFIQSGEITVYSSLTDSQGIDWPKRDVPELY